MNNILKFMMSLLIVFTLGGCSEDWLNVNKDPNVPTTPELSQLLSFSQVNMSKSLSQGDYIGNNLSGYVHQMVSRETQNYGMGTQANNIYNSWNYMYRYALVNLDGIITNAEPQGNLIYTGIAKTLKAYLFSMMVDLWGDIPYSEFNVLGLKAPKPDSSKDVYNALLVLLDDAKADLENTGAANVTVPGTDDLIYGGDEAKWIRLNNTLKLKLLLQSRKAKADIVDWQSKFNALIAADKFIAEGEDFQFWYNATTNPSDERHPAYIDEYAGGQVTYYVSPFFYEVMKGEILNVTDNPFGGLTDPRIPYYFFNQLKGNDSQNPHEYRNGNFMSIFFASAGPNSAHANDGSTTKIGIYPCGGKYDDGNGGTISKFKQGSGAAPHKMITYAALKFMLAELALTGETTGNAKTLFTEAMTAAIDHVNTVAAKQEGVPLITTTVRDNFVNSIIAKYDAANSAGKLRILMTQKWIHNFFNPIDSYTDYRRTGYPTLFDPSKTQNPGFGVNPTVTAKSAAAVPLENIASFPRSLYYPTTSETNLNPNMSQKVNLSTPFVFWDK